MVDTKTPGDKTLSVPTKTLTLKPRVETGTVRQSFSHGRTKQVVVEKRGKRRVGGDAPATETHAPEPTLTKSAPAAPAKAPLARPATPAAPRAGSGVVLRTLTEDERSARASALADAKVRDMEERRLAEEEAKRRNSKEGIEQAEREAAEARRKAEEERHRHDEEAKRKAELEAKKRFGEAEAKTAARATLPAARAPGIAADISDEDEGPRQIRRGPGGAVRPAAAPKTTAKPAPQKQRGRLTLVTALNADDVRERSIASFRRRTQRLKGHASNEPKEKLVREVRALHGFNSDMSTAPSGIGLHLSAEDSVRMAWTWIARQLFRKHALFLSVRMAIAVSSLQHTPGSGKSLLSQQRSQNSGMSRAATGEPFDHRVRGVARVFGDT